MKLYNLKIEGYRRHWNTEINLSNATFLIGENNVGKSSILTAIETLLTDKKKLLNEEYFHICDEDTCNFRLTDKVVLTAEFRDLPREAKEWRGFKGRVFSYMEDGEEKYKIYFRKIFEYGKDYIVEMKEYSRSIKDCFKDCKTADDYISNGLEKGILIEMLGEIDTSRNLTATQKNKILELEDIYDYSDESFDWFKNPGGIPGNVLSKLPRVLIIPAQDKTDEMTGKSGALITTLNELFSEVRDNSSNFKEAQKYLELLALEMDPSNTESEFGKMMEELNGILGDVFPKTGIHTMAKLSDADKVISPQFTVNMSSNIKTPVEMQGTGTIRAAVFALLRYRAIRENKKITENQNNRHLIVGFEEPELYLHPNAAQQMRETIYLLASMNNNQIICTTHSPYMIDLGQKPNQILNLLTTQEEELEIKNETMKIEIIQANPFNTSEAFCKLQNNEQTYIKMLLKIDDYVAKVFFAKNVLIVEGDTEEIVIKETINRLSEPERIKVLQEWQVIKARGKASIISLVKYLKAMGIKPYVIHDLDIGTKKAEEFNEPISKAVNDSTLLYPLDNCMEDVLGYTVPTYDKPYKAYKFITDNWNDFDDIPKSWADIFKEIFKIN